MLTQQASRGEAPHLSIVTHDSASRPKGQKAQDLVNLLTKDFPLTQAELATQAGVSRAYVCKQIPSLIAKGLIKQVGKGYVLADNKEEALISTLTVEVNKLTDLVNKLTDLLALQIAESQKDRDILNKLLVNELTKTVNKLTSEETVKAEPPDIRAETVERHSDPPENYTKPPEIIAESITEIVENDSEIASNGQFSAFAEKGGVTGGFPPLSVSNTVSINSIDIQFEETVIKSHTHASKEKKSAKKSELSLFVTNDNQLEGPDLFAQWYQAYPRKVAKGAAQKAFSKLSISDQQKAVNTLQPWLNNQDFRGAKIQFCPHPATWLNSRRFEDELNVPTYQLDNTQGTIFEGGRVQPTKENKLFQATVGAAQRLGLRPEHFGRI